MSDQDSFPDTHWLHAGRDENGAPEAVSPFLDPRLQLGLHSLPIPTLTDANPVSLQVAASPARQQDVLLPVTATVLQRGAAKFTDWFLTGFLYFLPVIFWSSRMPWVERSALLSLAFLFGIPAHWLTWFVYNLLLNGRTLGKRLFGLEVLTDTWERLTAGRNLGRVWAESLSWGLLGIGYLFAVFDPAKRTLHDHLCGTRVVLRPPR